MTGTNPGAWPDQWHGDVDDGKRKAFAEGNGLRYHYNRKGEISRIMARNRAGDWESLTCDFVKGEF